MNRCDEIRKKCLCPIRPLRCRVPGHLLLAQIVAHGRDRVRVELRCVLQADMHQQRGQLHWFIIHIPQGHAAESRPYQRAVVRAEEEACLADGLGVAEHVLLLHCEHYARKLGHRDRKLHALVPDRAQTVVHGGARHADRVVSVEAAHGNLHKGRQQAARGPRQVARADDLDAELERVRAMRCGVTGVVPGVSLHVGLQHVPTPIILLEASGIDPHRPVRGLAVERRHLAADIPVRLRIEVARVDAPAGGVDAGHLADVVLVEFPALCAGNRKSLLLGKAGHLVVLGLFARVKRLECLRLEVIDEGGKVLVDALLLLLAVLLLRFAAGLKLGQCGDPGSLVALVAHDPHKAPAVLCIADAPRTRRGRLVVAHGQQQHVARAKRPVEAVALLFTLRSLRHVQLRGVRCVAAGRALGAINERSVHRVAQTDRAVEGVATVVVEQLQDRVECHVAHLEALRHGAH
eukprot:m.67267 g.67267  ORF g.67267 m.67267 type:complete len:462 (+) comp7447_c0_seq1:35-1420(+)